MKARPARLATLRTLAMEKQDKFALEEECREMLDHNIQHFSGRVVEQRRALDADIGGSMRSYPAGLDGAAASDEDVGRIELRQLPEPLRLQYLQMVLVKGDQAVLVQHTENPVDVDDAHSGRVGNDVLCQRQFEGVVSHQADTAKARVQFAKEVCKVRCLVVPPHIGEPNPQRCLFDQRYAHEYPGEFGMSAEGFRQGLPV